MKSVDRLTGDEAFDHLDAIVAAFATQTRPGRRQARSRMDRGTVSRVSWSFSIGVIWIVVHSTWPEWSTGQIGHPPLATWGAPSDVGPEAIVRLQIGGLKVAEVLLGARMGEGTS